MIIACLNQKALVCQEITFENQQLLKNAVWIDLLLPSKAEEALVEQWIGLNIPTREEMIEIEPSSRLYQEDGTLVMTALMIAQADSDPKLDAVTFMLTSQQLITLRYIEPQSFKLFNARIQKLNAVQGDAISLFVELLETTVDRLADILELVGRRLEEYSKTIFRLSNDSSVAKLDYQQLMQQMGSNADINTKAHESLLAFNRLIAFFAQTASARIDSEKQLRVATLSRDITALNEHANFLSGKIVFLLEATLGMVNIEQNNIIKIFSVAAVIFLPPTLIASIYGMNFHAMPELSWKWGYLMAVGLMAVSSWLPYKLFKRKKWL